MSDTPLLNLKSSGMKIGEKAPDFTLYDQLGCSFNLELECQKGPILLVFYPGDFTAVCTKQLCDYRDNFAQFSQFGLQVVGISKDASDAHGKFIAEYRFPFRLLTDAKNQVAKQFGCSSKWMLGLVSRAVFIIGKNQTVLYQYIEPTAVTRRSASQLITEIQSLKEQGKL